jgi:uncharacterized membrane protein
MRYLVQTAQNSLTASILLAVILALAGRGDGAGQKRWLTAGSVVGCALALALAFLKHTTVLINREYWNIGILTVGVVSALVWMVLAGSPRLGGRSPAAGMAPWRGKLSQAAGAVFCGSLLFYTLPDIFLYPTEFVLMGESLFSTDFLFKLIGYAAGLLLAFIAGLALFKVSGSLSERAHRALLIVGLTVNLVNQALKVAQSLYARRLIPQSRAFFNLLKQAINHNDVFLYVIMAITALIPLAVWLRGRGGSQNGGGGSTAGNPAGSTAGNPSGSFAGNPSGNCAGNPSGNFAGNPAERRKLKAAARRRRRWSATVLVGYGLVILCLTAGRAYNEREVILSPAEPMNQVGDELLIAIERINDGHLHRFVYAASDGTEVRFIVIKKNEVAYGVGLDACDICGPTGYYERKDEVICKLCDVVMNKSTIGFKGGCNPVPLAYTLRDGSMVVRTADLELEKGRFK